MKYIKNFFIEEDLNVILGWLGIDYNKAMKNRIITSCVIACVVIFLGLYLSNLYIALSSIVISIG